MLQGTCYYFPSLITAGRFARLAIASAEQVACKKTKSALSPTLGQT